MNRLTKLLCLVLLGTVVGWEPALGQAPVQPAAVAPAAPAPATKLEAFKPAAGTVMTFGYNNLGTVSGISVDARELRDTKGGIVRGVAVEVTESEYREERSFVDTDELPELLKGIDALLSIKTNPTTFENFEVRYTTKGELQVTVFNRGGGDFRYVVQAGRTTIARRYLDEDGLRKLRTMFETAMQELSTQPAKH